MNNLFCETKTYNFNTRSSCGRILNSDTNYKSYIQYDVPDMIVRDDNIEFIEVSVPYAVIPVSFYTINHTNNVLSLYYDGASHDYSFEYGNYSVSLFVSAFNSFLSSLGFSISFDSADSNFTITNSSKSFSVLGTSTIDYILGFSDDIASTVVSGVNTVVMPRCVNFLPEPIICLRCEQFNATQLVGGGGEALITIPNNAKINGQIVYRNSTNAKILYRGNNLSNFTIRITNEDDELINFNGVSCFFSIQVDIYRKTSPKLPNFYEILNSLGVPPPK